MILITKKRQKRLITMGSCCAHFRPFCGHGHKSRRCLEYSYVITYISPSLGKGCIHPVGIADSYLCIRDNVFPQILSHLKILPPSKCCTMFLSTHPNKRFCYMIIKGSTAIDVSARYVHIILLTIGLYY